MTEGKDTGKQRILKRMRELHLTNTLTRKKEVFTPIIPGFVGMYVCGPTVYGPPHLGHAKSYVAFDVIRRYLQYLGYRVRYVVNITDVGHLTDDADTGEDKLLRQSRLELKEPMEIAEAYTWAFFRDMDALNVRRPDIAPRATGHIPEQIAMIRTLLEKGHAYEADGTVYFDVTSDPDYGKLSGRTLDEAEAGTRVKPAAGKRHAADFALWKRAGPDHVMKWDSPWSVGYPGWHIECSAMSTKYLGARFDIHGGGLENQFPHHECEIAQSECAHGHPFVNYWLHNNMVTLNGQKMGKSLGNAISLEQFFTGTHPLLSRAWSPAVIRFFLMQSHYRGTTDFSEGALEAAEAGMSSLHELIAAVMAVEPRTDGPSYYRFLNDFKADVEGALNDDVNTAKAIAVLFERMRALRTFITQQGAPSELYDIRNYIRSIVDGVLGIWPSEESGGLRPKLDAVMGLVLDIRASSRKSKDWATSDLIRDRLNQAGITVEDGPAGSTWKPT
jgi:cysteinyl-tRNA synthetase